jgi:hypothetical protein
MYSKRSGLTLAFHGCDKSVCKNVLNGKSTLFKSHNDYDWLGNGIYFWEYDPDRAIEYARIIQKYPKRTAGKIKNPAVIGAVIDLGYCLDLVNFKNLNLVRQAYNLLNESFSMQGLKLPENLPIGNTGDLLIRRLDCAVIETLHKINEDKGNKEYDSVRGVFWEGKELYPNSGFKEKNHIQICIRNTNCIKGYFLPLKLFDK